jgi:hypothetical protein
MTVEQYADVLVSIFFLAVPRFRKLPEYLDAIIDSKNHLPRGFFVVTGDVVVDLLKPIFRFIGPLYFRH